MSQTSQPATDFNAHHETYERFMSLIKVSVANIFSILVALVLYAFGGSWSVWTGSLIVFLAIVTALIGLFAGPRGWIPGALVFVLGVAFVVLTVA
ncbi:hypothetical protein [Rhodobium gokarnense]|uniref:Membrane protein YdbS with pleckstrin-like domain n=1 Tax=Rhodobium gokarnense TaxID=364296 RepID=A0ABT3H6W6_9HYPH|nr:hypothetical protein [Rhodobium gokarnense]MCW2306138.1 membrane protein YdbS with pleckstrin-like domain [Rhodobium gokarnense]